MSDLTNSIKPMFSHPRIAISLGILASAGLLGFAILGYYTNSLSHAFLPGIQVDGQPIGGQTLEEARALLDSQGKIPAHTITLTVDAITSSSTSAQLSPKRELEPALTQAFALGKTGSWPQRIGELLKVGLLHPNFATQLVYDQTKLSLFITSLKEKVDIVGVEPSATLATSGNIHSLTVSAGKDGRIVLPDETAQRLNQALNEAFGPKHSAQKIKPPSIADSKQNDASSSGAEATSNAESSISLSASVASTSAALTKEQQSTAKERAALFVGLSVQASSPDRKFVISDTDLVSMLAFPTGTSPTKLSDFVASLSKTISRPSQDATFAFDAETLAVTEFVPHRDGLSLDADAAKQQLRDTIFQLETEIAKQQAATEKSAEKPTEKVKPPEIALPVSATSPATTLAKTNSLGIVERIGLGESNYHHSIPGRVFNVGLTAKKINNVIVKPGEEFSFNKTLGEVSSRTGFKPAYVIKSGQTVLGDGGGVCQVSTTLFRALLDGGLQITKRKPHSYRVSYYELNSQPGFDATVFSGDVDLRFINDTNSHVLVHTEVDEPNLYLRVELYGTSDGRSSEISGYRSWDYRAPLATQYIPDPTLPSGKKVQVDWSQSGIKTTFKHTVKNKDGSIRYENDYFSNYQPWAAKYRVGM